MKSPSTQTILSESRRDFIKHSGGAVAATAVAGVLATPRFVHAAENHTIKIGLVGCGGRGAGAAVNALATAGPTKLWAMADVFEERITASLKHLSEKCGGQVEVPPERQFLGFDAYRKAIDSLDAGDVVLLATPPAFRPIHFEYAVARGVHVFMEKSFAVDAPGVRRVLRAGEEASKTNLKIAGGLMSRHYEPLQQAVQKVHDGAIGEPITCWSYREHGPVPFIPRSSGVNELGHQIRNYSCFTWLNGSFLLDWLIHNLDVCCWVKNAWPHSAQGQGGRQVRTIPDQLFDHYAVEYTFPDGTRLCAQGRHMADCWHSWGNLIQGTKGSAVLGEGISVPRLYRGYKHSEENLMWRYSGPSCDAYQKEHDRLFQAIREDKPYNETERCAKATLVGILGRLAAHSGQLVTWDDALASEADLAPGLEQLTWENDAPVLPDAAGRYPVAMPGVTKEI
jgi:predicted dehydrogenase